MEKDPQARSMMGSVEKFIGVNRLSKFKIRMGLLLYKENKIYVPK